MSAVLATSPDFPLNRSADQLLKLLRIEMKDPGEQTEDKDVLSFVLRGSAERFDRQPVIGTPT